MENSGNSFVELFKSSIITQSLLTVVLIGTLCALWIMQIPVPVELMNLTIIVVGFWFGSKIGYTQGKSSR